MQFFVDLHTGVDGQRSQLGEQQVSDRCIQTCPMNLLTEPVAGLLDPFFLTEIFRIEARAMPAFMIAQRHTLATPPADDQPLQQGWSFAWGAVTTIFAVSLTILLQLVQIRFVLFPGDVARADLPQEKWPLLLWDSFQVQ